VTTDPLALLVEVDRATTRLLATADGLDGDPATPSLLPGWSRGHLLTHLARNADSLVNLLTWARTGVVTPQYPSPERRAADIEAGAGRPWPVLVADVRDSAARFINAAEALGADDWTRQLDLPTGRRPAAFVPWRRLREVEVHHVDLAAQPVGAATGRRSSAAAYTPADWPEWFAHRLLHEVAGDLRGVSMTVRPDEVAHAVPVGAGGPPEVRGPVSTLAAWLTGRSPGTGLVIEPPGPLPAVPDWM
jgi:maleylpyruvate isomerase